MRKLREIFISLFILMLIAAPSSAAEKSFTILMINDPHSYILPYYEAASLSPDAAAIPVGGMARALYVVNEERSAARWLGIRPVFFFEGGDAMLGRKGASQFGAAEYGALEAARCDAGVLGNHDFDGGCAVLKRLGRTLKFPVLAANVSFHDKKTAKYYPKTAVISRGGVRLGLFGLVTPDVKEIISESCGEGFDVDKDIMACAEAAVRELRAKKADAIVALTHIGLEYDKKLASSVDGIDVIVGGHSHDAIKEPLFVRNPSGGFTLIGQAGQNGRFAGRFDLFTNGGLLREKSTWKLLAVKPETKMEPKAAALGRAAVKKIAHSIKVSNPTVVLEQAVDCRKQAVRTEENALCDVIADAMRIEASADVALLNGGSVRIDRIVPPGPLGPEEMLDLMPFRDMTATAMVTGAEIRRQLELSASSLIAEGENFDPAVRVHNGEFLQLSGLRCVIDLNEPAAEVKGNEITKPGSRVKSVSITRADGTEEPLDDARLYKAATLDYAAAHLKAESVTISNEEILALLDRRLGKLPGRRISPEPDGRIKIIPKGQGGA